MIKFQTLVDKFGGGNDMKGTLITLYDLQSLANPAGNYLGTWDDPPGGATNALPTDLTQLPSGAKRNDFAHVRNGNGSGTAVGTIAENWVIMSISGNVVTWVYDVSLGTDLTNKIDKVPTAVAGHIAKWNAVGELEDGGPAPVSPNSAVFMIRTGDGTSGGITSPQYSIYTPSTANPQYFDIKARLNDDAASNTLVATTPTTPSPMGVFVSNILQAIRNNLKWLFDRFNGTSAKLADALTTARSIDSNVDDSNLIETTPTFNGSGNVELVNTVNLAAVSPDNQDDLPTAAWKNSIKNLLQIIFNKLAGLQITSGNSASQVSSPSALEGGAYWKKSGHVVSAFLFCRKVNNGSSYTIQPGSQVVCGTASGIPTPSQYVGGFNTIVEGRVTQNGWAPLPLPTDGVDLVIGFNPTNNQVYIRNNGPNAYSLTVPSSGGGLRLGTLVTYITNN